MTVFHAIATLAAGQGDMTEEEVEALYTLAERDSAVARRLTRDFEAGLLTPGAEAYAVFKTTVLDRVRAYLTAVVTNVTAREALGRVGRQTPAGLTAAREARRAVRNVDDERAKLRAYCTDARAGASLDTAAGTPLVPLSPANQTRRGNHIKRG